jgi:hypothetical protein
MHDGEELDVASIGEDVPLLEGLRTTRAIRRLKPDPVPRALIRKVCEAGTFAPSGGNRQPWFFIAVTDTGRRAWVAERYRKVLHAYIRPAVGPAGAAPGPAELPGGQAPQPARRHPPGRPPARGARAPVRGRMDTAGAAASASTVSGHSEYSSGLPCRRAGCLTHHAAHGLWERGRRVARAAEELSDVRVTADWLAARTLRPSAPTIGGHVSVL